MIYRSKKANVFRIFLLISFLFLGLSFGTSTIASEGDINDWTINCADWKPDGNYAIIGGSDGFLAMFDGKSVSAVQKIKIEANQIAWNPNGDFALIVGDGGILAYNGDFIPLKYEYNHIYKSVDWNPDGGSALIGGYIENEYKENRASLLKYNGTNLIDITWMLNNNSSSSIRKIVWNPTSDFALIYCDDGKLYEYKAEEVTFIEEIENVFDLTWKPDGSELYILFNDLSIASWNNQKPFNINVLIKGEQDSNWHSGMIKWKPSGNSALVVGYDENKGKCNIYKYKETMELFDELTDVQITDIAEHPSGEYMLIVGAHKYNGRMLQKIVFHDKNSDIVLNPMLITLSLFSIMTLVYIKVTETGYYNFIKYFFLPLFNKFKKKRPLENKMRKLIYEYIELYPGKNYTSIKKDLGLANGTLIYHLNILRNENLIRSISVGRYKRFYPMGSDKIEKDRIYEHNGTHMLTDIQINIIEKIKQEPKISQVELAKSLGVSKQLVNYHVAKLIKAGVLRFNRKSNTFSSS